MAYQNFFALVAAYDLECEQIDVKSAFFNATILNGVSIFAQQPINFEKNSNSGKEIVCSLNKALYGLKQSAREWYFTIAFMLAKLNFLPLNCDQSVFQNLLQKTIIAIYVDDILIISPEINNINFLKGELYKKFEIIDLGPVSHYLGINITRDRAKRIISLNQAKYIDEKLTLYQKQDIKSSKTPMEPGTILTKNSEQAELQFIRQF